MLLSQVLENTWTLSLDGMTYIAHTPQAPFAVALRRASHILHIGHSVFFGPRDEYVKSAVGRLFLSEERGGEQA